MMVEMVVVVVAAAMTLFSAHTHMPNGPGAKVHTLFSLKNRKGRVVGVFGQSYPVLKTSIECRNEVSFFSKSATWPSLLPQNLQDRNKLAQSCMCQ